MQLLAVNVSGKVRREYLNGREYYVAPLTLIVSGVLNGSHGPLYYPPDEIAKDVLAWNHMPIVVYHPMRAGKNVSARDPDVLANQGIGFLARTKVRKGTATKLGCEGWFDVDAMRRVDERVLNALESEEPIELSTGLYTDNEPAPEGAVHNGRPYTWIARNYRPDHLAVLPDQVGACSIKDGCGVLVNLSSSEEWTAVLVANPKGQWEPPDAGEGAPKGVKDILKGAYSGCRDKNPAEKAAVKTKCAKIAWGAVKQAGWKKDASGEWRKLETNAMSDITDNYDLSAEDRRMTLSNELMERFGRECWLTEVYNDYVVFHRDGECLKLNYEEDESGEITLSEDKPVKVQKRTLYEPIENMGGATLPNPWEDNMAKALTQKQREAIADELMANCDCWSGDDDKEVLMNMTDDKLTQLRDHAVKEKQAITVANVAVHGFTDGKGNAFRVNPETGKWERRDVTANAPKKPDGMMMDDEEDDEEETANEKDRQKKNKKRLAGKVDNVDPDAPEPKPRGKQKTREQIINSLPQDIQETIRVAAELEQREKDRVIAQILTNSGVIEADKKIHYERLQKQPLDELVHTLSLIPKPVEDLSRLANNNQPKSRRRKVQNDTETDLLTPPTMNWEEVKTPEKTTPVNNDGDDFEDQSEDDWLQNAPASVRQKVQAAAAVEAREKRKIIDDMTANLSDEDEAKLKARLEKKSLDELRDLQTLAPKKEPPRPNYFGGSTQVANRSGRNGTNDVTEDVLPLPRIDWGDDKRK